MPNVLLVQVLSAETSDKFASIYFLGTFSHMPNSDDLVVIECAEVKAGDPSGLEWDLMALPSNKQMRETLCKSLLSVRTVASKSSSAGPSTPVLATGLPPKRSNSGAATMA